MIDFYIHSVYYTHICKNSQEIMENKLDVFKCATNRARLFDKWSKEKRVIKAKDFAQYQEIRKYLKQCGIPREAWVAESFALKFAFERDEDLLAIKLKFIL